MTTKTTLDVHTQHRPTHHFSVPEGWCNDPNGLIYHDGFYHLFYQYHPDAPVHGPMHWGHARSKNLLVWEHLPTALYPDEHGTIFSGSMVYDERNTSGFGTAHNPPLVAVFTYNDAANKTQTQGIAYSLDGGTTFAKYENNPVLTYHERDFRDPKVFWHEESQRWVMALSVGRCAHFYASKDLKAWEFLSAFTSENPEPTGIWECPDLCRIRVEDRDEDKWVLIVSVSAKDRQTFGMQYFVGTFDGKHFISETENDEILLVDFGFDNYAAVTFNNAPGRNLLLGWMNCWFYANRIPEDGFRGSMTLPRELFLRNTEHGYCLVQRPAREILEAAEPTVVHQNVASLPLPDGCAVIQLSGMRETTDVTLQGGRHALTVRFDREEERVAIDRTSCGCNEIGQDFCRTFSMPCRDFDTILLILDTISVELFTCDGEVVGTVQCFPDEPFSLITVNPPVPQISIGIVNT